MQCKLLLTRQRQNIQLVYNMANFMSNVIKSHGWKMALRHQYVTFKPCPNNHTESLQHISHTMLFNFSQYLSFTGFLIQNTHKVSGSLSGSGMREVVDTQNFDNRICCGLGQPVSPRVGIENCHSFYLDVRFFKMLWKSRKLSCLVTLFIFISYI